MSLTAQDKKIAKLCRAAAATPNKPGVWSALASESYEVAVALRDMLVAQGKMTVPQQ